MSLFNSLKHKATGAAMQTAGQEVGKIGNTLSSGGGKPRQIVFSAIPATLAQFAALPQAAMGSPFETAAMFVLALGLYKVDRNICITMINHLKGPHPLNQHDISFLNDRMAQNGKHAFIAESYLNGATPQNDYTPTEPYTVAVSDGPYSYQEQGYAALNILSGGADNPRPIKMRQAKDGKRMDCRIHQRDVRSGCIHYPGRGRHAGEPHT